MKVGIIGAGTMGIGIAQVFASADGYSVMLCDITKDLADKGKSRIERTLARRVEIGKLDAAQKDEVMAKITTGMLGDFGECDMVLEAAAENMQLKKDLFRQLQDICRKDTLFATNTSALSITELSQGLDRPVVGMHFFNPAPVMKLIEVIAGLQATDELVQKVFDIAKDIGKTPVKVEEGAGFVVNRLLITMVNEAVGVYADGLASVEDIDAAMRLGANHPMGPLALADLMGLDITLAIMEYFYNEFSDSKYRPHPLLRKMVRGGLLGRKSGEGFYQYDRNKQCPTVRPFKRVKQEAPLYNK